MAAPPNNTYFLDRDWQSAARLSLQHYISQSRQGYFLHPTVEASISQNPSPKILELGTGTGIWCIDAARAFPNATIIGTDISDSQFPPADTLGKHLSFLKYNFFDPVPTGLAGTFDIIHISYITAGLFGGGRDVVLKHVYDFLKPGGYVQWRDVVNPPVWVIDPKTMQQAGELPGIGIVEKLTGYVSAQDWTKNIKQVFADSGYFKDTVQDVVAMDPLLLNMETTLQRWNSTEFLSAVAKKLNTKEAIDGTAEALKATEAMIKDGKMFHWRFVVGIGRKTSH